MNDFCYVAREKLNSKVSPNVAPLGRDLKLFIKLPNSISWKMVSESQDPLVLLEALRKMFGQTEEEMTDSSRYQNFRMPNSKMSKFQQYATHFLDQNLKKNKISRRDARDRDIIDEFAEKFEQGSVFKAKFKDLGRKLNWEDTVKRFLVDLKFTLECSTPEPRLAKIGVQDTAEYQKIADQTDRKRKREEPFCFICGGAHLLRLCRLMEGLRSESAASFRTQGKMRCPLCGFTDHGSRQCFWLNTAKFIRVRNCQMPFSVRTPWRRAMEQYSKAIQKEYPETMDYQKWLHGETRTPPHEN